MRITWCVRHAFYDLLSHHDTHTRHICWAGTLTPRDNEDDDDASVCIITCVSHIVNKPGTKQIPHQREFPRFTSAGIRGARKAEVEGNFDLLGITCAQ